MISTFQALLVALLALLPGASYMFAYERKAGSFGSKSPDRLMRFLAASAVLQAVYSGPELLLYRNFVANHRLQQGQVNWVIFEVMVLGYVLLPYAIGTLVGTGKERNWAWVAALSNKAIEPRAWDWRWRRDSRGMLRLKLKSGTWIAGLWSEYGGRSPYAAGYPEEGDLYLSVGLQIDAETGEYVRNSEDQPVPVIGDAGLLIRWAEVEYLEFQEF